MSCENNTFTLTKRMILFFKRFLHVKLIHENKELFEVLELSQEDFDESENDPKYKDVHKRMEEDQVDDDEYRLGYHKFGNIIFEVDYEQVDCENDDELTYNWIIPVKIKLLINNKEKLLYRFYEEVSSRHKLIEKLDGLNREITLCKYCDISSTLPYGSFIDGSCANCYVKSTYGTEDCCICYSNDQLEPWIKLRGCNHTMHMRCAKTLQKCPICRAEIDSHFLSVPFYEFEEDIV